MENQAKFLLNTFLFRPITRTDAQSLIDELRYTVERFNKGDIVYSPDKYERKLGFVIRGGCSVYKYKSSDSNLFLNSLCPGDSFGILAVFSEEGEFPTVIEATKKTEILFIDAEECKALVSKSPALALSVISFLANKVSFLNTKISTLSGKNITERLAIYLLCESYKTTSNASHLNIRRASSALSVSRQSIYRAIEALASAGLITYEENKIYIKDQSGLERLTK